MRWQGRRTSGNVEDRRGMSGGKLAVGGGLGTLVIIVIVYLLGGNPGDIMNQLQLGGQEQTTMTTAEEDQLAEFVSVVLADCEDVWTKIFTESGQSYRKPKLVLYTSQVNSACGMAGSASGPFYCPLDEKIYIDLSFMEDMERKLNAPGDFAMAYVIAHEVGHHVQKMLGILGQVQELRGQVSEQEYNEYSVRLELQADFLAGVWAYHAEEMFGILEQGDIQEALGAANAVGDDRIQMQSQGYVVPDSFTHGTSAQRMKWFNKGFNTGDISQGDTFNQENI
ncbi:MAG TPA: neutral zinc metallopeptidase [Bacteroidales bacterium]|nr:neutral zinc metallopeptidase [Bacteroidales bacterium]HOX78579.1 neutral zinc metallopeptidase [Bacteroidales bacterium]HPI86447.1 neutral zinc metallopeptidase [Bacteroidales bacterium]HPM93401.1 neutral zinc metallopeptidase [Bacteroidales bacterium]